MDPGPALRKAWTVGWQLPVDLGIHIYALKANG
jgi:hypothetical protein